jgi:hypothetical protein
MVEDYEQRMDSGILFSGKIWKWKSLKKITHCIAVATTQTNHLQRWDTGFDLVNVKSFLLIITPKLINTHSPKNCWQCYFESTWVVTLYLKTPFWKIQIFGL